MGEYLPVKADADELTLTAGAAITGGQVVYLSADNTVSPTSGATNAIGVAGYDAASGDLVTVYTFVYHVHEVTAGGTIAAGNLVESAAAGKVVAHTLGTNDANVIGTALAAATNGNKVRILSGTS